MKEYKYVSLRKNIINTINDVAKEGWKLVAYSASNVFGSSIKYDVIFERDSDSLKSDENITEYKIVTTKGIIIDQINEYSLKGYKFVSFSNNTTFGSSISYDLVFERTIKIL